jgi:hypothetical protein
MLNPLALPKRAGVPRLQPRDAQQAITYPLMLNQEEAFDPMDKLHGPAPQEEPDEACLRYRLAWLVLRTAPFFDITVGLITIIAAVAGTDIASVAYTAIGAVATVNAAAIGAAGAAIRGSRRE